MERPDVPAHVLNPPGRLSMYALCGGVERTSNSVGRSHSRMSAAICLRRSSCRHWKYKKRAWFPWYTAHSSAAGEASILLLRVDGGRTVGVGLARLFLLLPSGFERALAQRVYAELVFLGSFVAVVLVARCEAQTVVRCRTGTCLEDVALAAGNQPRERLFVPLLRAAYGALSSRRHIKFTLWMLSVTESSQPESTSSG